MRISAELTSRRRSATSWLRIGVFVLLVLVTAFVLLWQQRVARAEIPLPEPLPLRFMPVPEPPNLAEFVRDRQAAIALGKALFWDMQLGSDGKTACASCHFKAGADGRAKNQIHPGADGIFDPVLGGPNATLTSTSFPFHQRQAPSDQQESPVARDSNDIGGSQGVRNSRFVDVNSTGIDVATPLDDPVFNVNGTETRRVTGRNAPSVINAIFNYANFWDGRANNIFNGVNPFGAADQESRVFEQTGGGLQGVLVRITNASLASQAVGPVLNDVEMSAAGRTFPKVGKKMLRVKPLDQQLVHVNDSALGSLSGQRQAPGQRGLSTSYSELIQAAFQPKYWSNTSQILTYSPQGAPTISTNPGGTLTTDQFTQMEANFSLFFGLAVQLYESTLVSNDSFFDRAYDGRENFSPLQQRGYDIFFGAGECAVCHAGSEFTLATYAGGWYGLGLPMLVEQMVMGDFQKAVYDTGYYNIGVTRTTDDVGRGGLDGFNFPLSFTRLGRMKEQRILPPAMASFVPDLPPSATGNSRVAIDGAFKTPSLRNVELTGPYFHNGSYATLDQVVEFYTRGGNFPVANRANLDAEIMELGEMQGHPEERGALVAFLKTLTDERVRWESAPFDHPELLIPDGAEDANPAADRMLPHPAVGAAGRAAEGLPPLAGFITTSRPPSVVDDLFSVPQNSASNHLDVLGNDGDLDGNAIAVVSTTPGANGTTAVDPERVAVLYTPAAGFTGADVFTYSVSDGLITSTGRVTVTVQAVNRAPEALFDLATVLANGTVNVVEVLLNDRDQDGNPIAIIAVTQPLNGTVTIDPLRDVVFYAPNPGFAGFDSFSYTISDGALTASANVQVKANRPPVAANDAFLVEGLPFGYALTVLDNDSDPDPDDRVEVIAITPPSKGTATIDPDGHHIVYTPKVGTAGTDRIDYVVSDGILAAFASVTVTIPAGNNTVPASVADSFTVAVGSTANRLEVLANDTDPEGGILFIDSATQGANGSVAIGPGSASVLYTPNPGFRGTDTFSYTVSDGILTNIATVTVNVGGPYRVHIPTLNR